MKTTRHFASRHMPETGIKLIEDEAHVAKVRRVRRQLCVGEDVRMAA